MLYHNYSSYLKDSLLANQALGAANTTIAACNERLAQIEAAVNKALQTMNEHADIRKQLEVIDMLPWP